MKTTTMRLLMAVGTCLLGGCHAGASSDAGDSGERVTFEATIDGSGYLLEAMLYRPQDGSTRNPLVVLTHGRNGPHPALNPDEIMLVMGQSQGGWVALAASTLPMEGVLGVVNLSGAINFRQTEGLNVRSPVNEGLLGDCARSYGASAQVPVLWLYAENDNHLPDSVRGWFTAFQEAGGSGSLVIEPPYGTNGHQIVSQPSLYLDDLLGFFRSVGFVRE